MHTHPDDLALTSPQRVHCASIAADARRIVYLTERGWSQWAADPTYWHRDDDGRLRSLAEAYWEEREREEAHQGFSVTAVGNP